MKNRKKQYLRSLKLAKKLATVAMLSVTLAGASTSLVKLTGQTAYAAEYKSGQDGSNKLEFTAVSKTNTTETKVAQHKPMDLDVIIDYSSSFQGKRNTALKQLKTLIQTDLTDEDHVMLQAYIYNKPTSYAAHGAQLDYSKMKDADWETGVSTVLLSKSEALAMIDKLLQIKYPGTPGGLPTYSDLFNAVSKTFGDKAFKTSDKDGEKVTVVPFEDVYTSQTNKNKMVSVIQFTDGWADTEKMDGTFAAWAKSNAKTFMSVVNRNKVSNEDNNDPNSNKSMTELGHPNIYDVTGKDEATVVKEMLEQFKNTATEKVVTKSTTTKQKGQVEIIPEQGITLKSAELVDPSGKKTTLTIKDNKVVYDAGELADGKYTVNYTFNGNVESVKKIVASAKVDGKEVAKAEDTVKPVEKVVAKPKQQRSIPRGTQYKSNADVESGKVKLLQEMVPDIETTGGNIETVEKTEGKDRIIEVGTKPTTSTEDLAFKTIYRANEELEAGQKKVAQEGVKGSKSTTTTYSLKRDKDAYRDDETYKDINKVTANILDKKVGEPKIVEAKDEIIEVGTKPKVEKEKIPYQTIEEQDPTLAEGERKVKIKGVEGLKTTTTTYSLDEKTGEVTPSVKTDEEPKTDEVILVGTKKKAAQVKLRFIDQKSNKSLKDDEIVTNDKSKFGDEFSLKPEKELKVGKDLYRLVEIKLTDSKEDSKIEGLSEDKKSLTSKVTEAEQSYDAVYERVVYTSYVDENGKELDKTVEGAQDKKEIKGYDFVKTEKSDNGDVKHIYRAKPIKGKTPTKYAETNEKSGVMYSILGLIGAAALAESIRRKKQSK